MAMTSLVKPMPNMNDLTPWTLFSYDLEMSSLYGNFPVPHRNDPDYFFDPWVERWWVTLSQEEQENPLNRPAIMRRLAEEMASEIVFEPAQPAYDLILKWVQTSFQLLQSTSTDRTRKQSMSGLDTYTEGVDDDNVSENDEEIVVTKKDITQSPKLGVYMHQCMQNEEINESTIRYRFAGDPITYIGVTTIPFGTSNIEEAIQVMFVTNTFKQSPCIGNAKWQPAQFLRLHQHGSVKIHAYNDEISMIEAFVSYLGSVDPDILLGYNTGQFDNPYIVDRALELYALQREGHGSSAYITSKMNDLFGSLGRSKDNVFLSGYQNRRGSFSSSSSTSSILDRTNWMRVEKPLIKGKYHDMYMFWCAGRIQIDLLMYIKRQFDYSENSLDAVSSLNIGDVISNVRFHSESTTELLELECKGSTAGVLQGDYIQLYVETMRRIPRVGKFQVHMVEKKKLWLLINDETRQHVPDEFRDWTNKKGVKWGWGLVKDDLPPKQMRQYSISDNIQERLLVAKYCIQDCLLVVRLFHKLDVWTGLVEMVRLCRVPVETILYKGLGQRLTSYVSYTCRRFNTMIPYIHRPYKVEESALSKKSVRRQPLYKGAWVLDPAVGAYLGTKQVLTLDFNSLYPTVMASHNLCSSTKLYVVKIQMDTGAVVFENRSNGILLNSLLEQFEEFSVLRPYVEGQVRNLELLEKDHRPPELVSFQAGYRVYLVRDENETTRIVQFSLWLQPVANYLLALLSGSNPVTNLGILPQIVVELLEGRKIAKKQKELAETDVERSIYDNRQLTMKLQANSIYGQTGSETSSFSDPDVAASITCIGRTCLEYTVACVKHVFRSGTFMLCPSKMTGTIRPTIVPRSVSFSEYVKMASEFGVSELVSFWRKEYITFLKTYRPIEYSLLVDVVPTFLSGHFALENTNGFLDYMKIQKAYILDDTKNNEPAPMCFLFEDKLPVMEVQSLDASRTLHVKDGTCIYGDTDSVFIHFPSLSYLVGDDEIQLEDNGETLYIHFALGHWMASLVSMFLPPPMKLVFEKSFRNFMMLGKKRYFGLKYETSFQEFKPSCTGLNLKKKDSCSYAKDVGIRAYNIMITDNDEDTHRYLFSNDRIQRVLNYFKSVVINLQQRDFTQDPPEDLILTKSLNNKYAKPHSIPHWVLAMRMRKRDAGSAPKPGERVRYLVVLPAHIQSDLEAEKLPMSERIESYEYYMELPPHERPRIDLRYYIVLQLLNPLLPLFRIFFHEVGVFFNPDDYSTRQCQLQQSIDILKTREQKELYMNTELTRTILRGIHFETTLSATERKIAREQKLANSKPSVRKPRAIAVDRRNKANYLSLSSISGSPPTKASSSSRKRAVSGVEKPAKSAKKRSKVDTLTQGNIKSHFTSEK